MKTLGTLAFLLLIAVPAFAGFSVDLPVVTRVQGASTFFYTSLTVTNNSATSTDVLFEYISADYTVDASGMLVAGLAGHASFHTDDLIQYMADQGFLTRRRRPPPSARFCWTSPPTPSTAGNEASAVARIYNYQTAGQRPSIGFAYRGLVVRQNGKHSVASVIRNTAGLTTGPDVSTNLGLGERRHRRHRRHHSNPVTIQLRFYDGVTGAPGRRVALLHPEVRPDHPDQQRLGGPRPAGRHARDPRRRDRGRRHRSDRRVRRPEGQRHQRHFVLLHGVGGRRARNLLRSRIRAFDGDGHVRAGGRSDHRDEHARSNITADAIASLPNGTVWSVDFVRNTISETTFPDLTVTTFNVPTPNSGLAGITAGPDGNMWFAESSGMKIGRIEPNGTISEYGIPTGAAAPQRIFPGPHGTLWATSCPFLASLFRLRPVHRDHARLVRGASMSMLPIRSPSQTSFGPSRCTLGGDDYVWCIGNEIQAEPVQLRSSRSLGSTPPAATALSRPSRGVAGLRHRLRPDTKIYYTWVRAGDSTGIASVSPQAPSPNIPVMTGNTIAGSSDWPSAATATSTSPTARPASSTSSCRPPGPFHRAGPLTIDIPEDLVPGGGSASAGCPAGGAFVVRSGGSPSGELVWIRTQAPTQCTDVVAAVGLRRFAGFGSAGFAGCFDDPDSHDDASAAVLSIQLPAGSQVATDVSSGFFLESGTCTVTGPSIRCDIPSIRKGFGFEVAFFGVIEAGEVSSDCSSATPESEPDDNDDVDDGLFGLPSQDSPPVERPSRELLGARRIPH